MPFTKFRTKEDQLLFSKEQSLVWINHSPVCTKIVDLNFNLQFMSSAGVMALGIEDITEYYGKPYPFDFYPLSFCEEMSSNLRKALETGDVVEQEAAVLDTAGNELWFHSTISPVGTERNQVGYLMVVSIDTTSENKTRKKLKQLNDTLEGEVRSRTLELELANTQLRQLSETDFLTRLPNRLAFDRRIGENIATAKRNKLWLSLLMVDIDDFKKYNDKHGHNTGDRVLQIIAETISSSLLRKTDLSARYGGEEFVILLPDMDADRGLEVAEKIRTSVESLKDKFSRINIISPLTVSIGVASLKGDRLNATDLLQHADKALYVAKNAGKNNCQVANTM